MNDYPNTPGSKGTDTSLEAAEALAPNLGRLQQLVLRTIRAAGRHGLTADETAAALKLDRWTVQPRTSELRRLGKLRDSGIRRRNLTGKRAIVWCAPEFAPADPAPSAANDIPGSLAA